jgi:NADH-quinone oxidoreductase subunit G
MPDSHRLNFHYVDSDARLTEPLSRGENGTHEATTWSKAMAQIAAKCTGYQANQIAVIGSGRMTNEELFLTQTLSQKLGNTALSLVPRSGEADHLLIAADRNPNTTGAQLIWKKAAPAASLDAIRDGVRNGQIKVLFSFGEDLITDAGFTAAELAKLDFHVHSHILANPTAQVADLVLPASAFAEKRGSMVNLSGRLQRLNAACTPPEQAHDDWEILRDLIQAITGEKQDLAMIEQVFKQLSQEVKEFENLTLSKIGDQGLIITSTDHKIPLLENERARKAAGIING